MRYTNALSDGDQPLAGSRVTDVHITSSAENTAQGINLLGDSALTVTDSIIEATAQTNTIGVYGYYADAVTVELVNVKVSATGGANWGCPGLC